jgi:hypothetical protein
MSEESVTFACDFCKHRTYSLRDLKIYKCDGCLGVGCACPYCWSRPGEIKRLFCRTLPCQAKKAQRA